eukprot:gene24323-9931_t
MFLFGFGWTTTIVPLSYPDDDPVAGPDEVLELHVASIESIDGGDVQRHCRSMVVLNNMSSMRIVPGRPRTSQASLKVTNAVLKGLFPDMMRDNPLFRTERSWRGSPPPRMDDRARGIELELPIVLRCMVSFNSRCDVRTFIDNMTSISERDKRGIDTRNGFMTGAASASVIEQMQRETNISCPQPPTLERQPVVHAIDLHRDRHGR